MRDNLREIAFAPKLRRPHWADHLEKDTTAICFFIASLYSWQAGAISLMKLIRK